MEIMRKGHKGCAASPTGIERMKKERAGGRETRKMRYKDEAEQEEERAGGKESRNSRLL
jgi:hypothetical protein